MKSFENPTLPEKDQKPKEAPPTLPAELKITFEKHPKVPKKDAELKITIGTPKIKDVPGNEDEPKNEVQKIVSDRGGKVDWIPQSAKSRREPGRNLAEFKETEVVLEAVVSGFFEKYSFAKKLYDKDPDMLRTFRAGVAELIKVALEKNTETTPSGLQNDDEFIANVLKLADKIEGDEKDRKRSARGSAAAT